MFARPSGCARGRIAIGLALVGLGAFGCQSGAPAASSTTTFRLGGTAWRAVEIEGRATDPEVASTVAFEGDQRVSGSTGCNRYTAPLSVTGTSIRLGVIAMTRRACPPPVTDQESRFIAALEAARGYRQEGDVWLLDEQGRTLLRLARA
jgi:heat shock protein HslJ